MCVCVCVCVGVCSFFFLFWARAQTPTRKAEINGPGLYGAVAIDPITNARTLYIGNSIAVRRRNLGKADLFCVKLLLTGDQAVNMFDTHFPGGLELGLGLRWPGLCAFADLAAAADSNEAADSGPRTPFRRTVMSALQLALAALEMLFVAEYDCTTETTFEKAGSSTKVPAGIEAALPRADDATLLARARVAGEGLTAAGVGIEGAAILMLWSTGASNNKQPGVLHNHADHGFLKRKLYKLAGIDFPLILNMFVSVALLSLAS